ncbi:HD domain-containing phosphohydrolase [Candidatus Omnitrophota bacterium]
MPEKNSILLIDDHPDTSGYLQESLGGDYSLVLKSSAEDALACLSRQNFDLVIARFEVEGSEGDRLLKGIKKADPDSIIIVLTDDQSRLQNQVFRLGVYGAISKPINSEKFLFLVKKGIELHSLLVSQRRLNLGLQEKNISLKKQNVMLANRVEDSTKNLSRLYESLRTTYMRTIKVLAQAIDARDHYTHSHSENVSGYACAIANEMGLSAHEIEMIREACELHDLGKIGIQDSILTKPAKLNEEEWVKVKRHPEIASEILEPLTFLNEAREMIKQHHEHFDGSGYPLGLRGNDILLGARIIHLADAYDAMRSSRAYRKEAFTKDEAVAEIKKESGKQFDPAVVKSFLNIVDRL